MKKILSYFIMFGAVAALTLSSCAKKEAYQPGEPDSETCYGVYFPSQEASGSHTYDPEMERTLTVTVARNQEKPYIDNAITVPYVIKTATEGVFQAGNITFEAGQAETALEISFEKAELGTNYAATLEITDTDYASKYSSKATYLNFDVLVVAWQYVLNPKGEKALFEFTQGWWNETAWAYVKYYEVNGIRTCFTETQSKHYNAQTGEYYEGYGFFGTAKTPEEATEWTFRWYTKNLNADGNQLIELPFQYCGYTTSAGVARNVSDVLWYYITDGQITPADWLVNAEKNGAPSGAYPCGYYDGNGGIYLYTTGYYYNNGSGLVGSWTDSYEVVGIGEGFVRTDFSLSIEADYPADGVTPVYVEAGADVAAIKYAIYPGELKEDEVKDKLNAIAAGTEEATEFSEFELDEESGKNFATLGLSPETTGTYTIAVVGFDAAGSAQVAESLVFNFVAADDQADYQVSISAFTEDTPARYKELHKYDSFAFGIAGQDITEAHLAIVTEVDVKNYGVDAIMEMIKADARGQYTVSADVLSDINADGGYYDIASGLAAKTTYYVIVWATNGSMDNFAVASYTTEKLPYVWNSLGKGTITDGFFVHMFGNRPDYTVACDVYEEANTPGLYMITGFQCALTANFFSMSEEGMAPYENENWRNSEVVVDATNPDAVVIPEQDYGVLVNSNYGWVKIQTEATGKLENGVITFPVKEMYVYLGSWYYANGNGTFKITLPSTTAPTSITPLVMKSDGVVDNATLSSGATSFNKAKVKYERDPQPVKANVTVSYTRKAKESGRNNMVVTRDSDQRFFE